MADLGPGFDDLAVWVSLVKNSDAERVVFVAADDSRDLAAVALFARDGFHDQFERQAAVGVGNLNGRFTGALRTEFGIKRLGESDPRVIDLLRIADTGAEIAEAGSLSLIGGKEQGRGACGKQNVLRPETARVQ